MRESQLEKRLKHRVEAWGGKSLKFVSPGMSGVPDRLIIFPMGRIVFAEVKTPGQKLRALQFKRKQQLEQLGCQVYVIDSLASIDQLLREVGP
ncbi:VRR-NUC domain-containing protein [Bacillus sp. FSL W7-1360]